MYFEWLLNTCLVFSGQAILTLALMKILRLRHLAIVWAVASLPCIVSGYLNTYPVYPQAKVVWSFVCFVVTVWMYWAFASVKPSQRLVAISCCYAAALAVEFPIAAIFLSQGFSFDDISTFVHDRPDVYVFALVFHAVVLAIFLLLIYGFVGRIFSDGDEWAGMKAALPPTAQLCLILIAFFSEREIVKKDESFIMIAALLAVIVLAAYAFFCLVIRRWHNAELEEARIKNLREKSEQAFQQVEGFIEEAENLAKFRHDLKNQLQVAEFLSTSGEKGRALDGLSRLESVVGRRVVRP